jgi:hypothetical protein
MGVLKQARLNRRNEMTKCTVPYLPFPIDRSLSTVPMYRSLYVLVTSNDHRGVSTPRCFLNYPKVKPVPVDTAPATGAVSQVTGTV